MNNHINKHLFNLIKFLRIFSLGNSQTLLIPHTILSTLHCAVWVYRCLSRNSAVRRVPSMQPVISPVFWTVRRLGCVSSLGISGLSTPRVPQYRYYLWVKSLQGNSVPIFLDIGGNFYSCLQTNIYVVDKV